MAQRLIGLIALCLVICSCGEPMVEGRVASWEGGSLSRVELDGFIMALPMEDRRVDTADPRTWWSERAEEAVLRRLLLAAAGPLDEELARTVRDQRRQALVDAELSRRFGAPDDVSEEAVQKAWEEFSEGVAQTELREVYNIFRSAGDPESKERAARELEDVRQRVLAGESFWDLAEELSDSESRHMRGLVGIVEATEAEESELDEILFSLTPELPSEVLRTADGAHLFWVRLVRPGRAGDIESSRPELIKALQAEAGLARLEEAATELWQPRDGDLVLDEEGLLEAMRKVEDSIIIRLGETEWSRNRWYQWSRSLQIDAESLPTSYRVLVNQEKIFLSIEDSFELDERTLAALALSEEKLRADRQLLAELPKLVGDEELELYFSANSRQFAPPPRSRFRRLEIPWSDSPVEQWGQLEAARAALDEGRVSIEQLAKRFGGRVDELGWMSSRDLARVLPWARQSVFGLEQGRHSAPLTNGSSIVILQVVATEEAEIPELESIRDQVIAVYAEAERARLMDRVETALFEAAGVRFDTPWLDELS